MRVLPKPEQDLGLSPNVCRRNDRGCHHRRRGGARQPQLGLVHDLERPPANLSDESDVAAVDQLAELFLKLLNAVAQGKVGGEVCAGELAAAVWARGVVAEPAPRNACMDVWVSRGR